MFDTVSNWLILYLIKRGKLTYEQYDDFDLAFKGNLQGILTLISLILMGLYFKILIPIIIISIIFNIISKIIEVNHAPSLELCLIYSTILVSIFAWLSKISTQYSLLLFYISIFCGIWIIKYLHKDIDEDAKNKTQKYYRNNYINWFLFFYVCSLVSIQLGVYIISTSISFGIFLVVITLKYSNKSWKGVIENESFVS